MMLCVTGMIAVSLWLYSAVGPVVCLPVSMPSVQSILPEKSEVRTTPPRLQGARFDESFVTLELQFDSRVATRRFGGTFVVALFPKGRRPRSFSCF